MSGRGTRGGRYNKRKMSGEKTKQEKQMVALKQMVAITCSMNITD